jgi:isocitrate dehydrogenase (NAD+)
MIMLTQYILERTLKCEYSRIEHIAVDSIVQRIKIIIRDVSKCVLRFAFQYAENINRPKVCAVHKATIMKIRDSLFLGTARRVAKDFLSVEFDAELLDNTLLKDCY